MTQYTQSFSKSLRLSSELSYFQGHFPGLPVLPAVGFINLSHQFIEDSISAPLVLVSAHSFRFKQPLFPESKTLLTIFQKPDSPTELNRISFFVKWTSQLNELEIVLAEGHLDFYKE